MLINSKKKKLFINMGKKLKKKGFRVIITLPGTSLVTVASLAPRYHYLGSGHH